MRQHIYDKRYDELASLRRDELDLDQRHTALEERLERLREREANRATPRPDHAFQILLARELAAAASARTLKKSTPKESRSAGRRGRAATSTPATPAAMKPAASAKPFVKPAASAKRFAPQLTNRTRARSIGGDGDEQLIGEDGARESEDEITLATAETPVPAEPAPAARLQSDESKGEDARATEPAKRRPMAGGYAAVQSGAKGQRRGPEGETEPFVFDSTSVFDDGLGSASEDARATEPAKRRPMAGGYAAVQSGAKGQRRGPEGETEPFEFEGDFDAGLGGSFTQDPDGTLREVRHDKFGERVRPDATRDGDGPVDAERPV